MCRLYRVYVVEYVHNAHQQNRDRPNFLVWWDFKILGSMHTGWWVGFAPFKEYTQFGACVHVMKVDRSHFLTSLFEQVQQLY